MNTTPHIDGYTAAYYQHTATGAIRRLFRLRNDAKDGKDARKALAYWIGALRRCRQALSH